MRNRLLLLLFLLLALIAFWLWKSNTGSTLTGPLTDFAVPDSSKVSRIFIADKDGSHVDLKREANGRWTVNGVPANPIPVSTLLKTFLRVEVRTPVPKSMEANVLKVMASVAKKVEIYEGGDEPSRIWWVGHATQDHFGTFALLEKPGVGKSNSPFILGMGGFTGILTTRFHTRLDEWRSTEVAIYPNLEKVKKVQVEHPSTDSAGYTITFNGGSDLALLDASGAKVPMDTVVVQDLLMHLRDAHFEYFERKVTKAQRDSVLNTKPWHVMSITDAEQKTLRIPFWKKNPYPGERDMDLKLLVQDNDRMYALLNDTALVVVQRYWFDRMVPWLGRLRKR